jgi:N-acetylmuramoyl-L-alanine amidase
MEVVKAHIPAGHPNRPGTKLRALKAIVVHYTQNEEPGATDTMNVKYIGRKFVLKDVNGEAKKFEADGKTPFRFGSAHVFCDMDSVTEAIPLDEVAWNCGDKNYKGGYQRVAEKVFKFRQNYETIGVEICNNDTIKNSDEDWEKAAENAKQWIITFLKSFDYKVNDKSLAPQLIDDAPVPGSILILRHYDITGKVCPKKFVDDPNKWANFVKDILVQVG